MVKIDIDARRVNGDVYTVDTAQGVNVYSDGAVHNYFNRYITHVARVFRCGGIAKLQEHMF